MTSARFRNRLCAAVLGPITLAGLLCFPWLANGQEAYTPKLLDALREPPQVTAVNGRIDHPLNAVFGKLKIATPSSPVEVAVRAYASPNAVKDPTKDPTIPGPTFVFQPGDLLRIRFHNLLNASQNPALNQFGNNIQQGGPGASDDIRDHVAHEISIPNNSNLTNLHVHGLHVDPKQDNVTLLILPEDNSPSDLSVGLQRFVPTINRWWYRPYQYKIPRDHIPGTYWYHSHKHGSTSTQVENGMAGTLLMLPTNDSDDIVPGLWNVDPNKTHDRVLMIQEIANYGVPQQGNKPRKLGSKNAGPPNNLNAPIVTINGQSQPTLKLAPGQLERWRFLVAGANHTAAGSLWVGKYVMPPLDPGLSTAIANIKDVNDSNRYVDGTSQFPVAMPAPQCAKIPGAVKLICLDGVPMRQPVDITPATPTLGGAGNRVDLLVQPDESAANSGPYFVYQNYPAPSLTDLKAAYPDLFGDGISTLLRVARYAAVTKGQVVGSTTANPISSAPPPTKDVNGKLLPSSLNQDTYALGTNYWGFVPNWGNVDANGDIVPYNPVSKTGSLVQLPVGPLLSGQKNAATNGVNAALPDAANLNDITQGRFQPMPDDPSVGGLLPATAAALMALNITGTANGPKLPANLADRLSSLSPAGTGSMLKRVNKAGQLVPGIPAYVAPFPPQVDGRQVVVFDRGEFTFDYTDKLTAAVTKFRQFWIDGRQFNVDDFVGNPKATQLIQTPVINVEPDLGVYKRLSQV